MKQFFLAIAMLVVCSYVIGQAAPVSTMIEKNKQGCSDDHNQSTTETRLF